MRNGPRYPKSSFSREPLLLIWVTYKMQFSLKHGKTEKLYPKPQKLHKALLPNLQIEKRLHDEQSAIKQQFYHVINKISDLELQIAPP